MNIRVTLNGTKRVLEAYPGDSLMNVLRKNGFGSVKCGCTEGFCGACTVLLDDKPVAACKIPVGIVNNSDIVTLEYFSRTKEYNIILQGFELANIHLCGYCNSGKVFSAYSILKMNKIPTRQEITAGVKHLAPCCTDLNTLVNGIILAVEINNNSYEKVRERILRKA